MHQLGLSLGVRIVRGVHRVSCRTARRLGRRTPVQGLRGRRGLLLARDGRGPWIDLYERRDGRVLVGTVRAGR